MTTKLIIYNNVNRQKWDLTNTVESITITSSLYDQPGQCSFTLLSDMDFPNGSAVYVLADNKGIFFGYIFDHSLDEKGNISYNAYDRMRYLKNEDTIYFENKTTSQIFTDICAKWKLPSKVIDKCNYINLPYLYDKKTSFDIIKTALEETLRNTGKMYIVRDNYGILEFIDVANNKTNLVIGTNSIMTDFTFSKSIDKNTYNIIKLSRDNNSTGKRDVWQIKDTDNISKWGMLQYYDTVDENASEEQIKRLASNMLKVLNRETRELSFGAIGFYNLKAGDGIKVQLPKINEWFVIKSITTIIKNDYVENDIEVYIP